MSEKPSVRGRGRPRGPACPNDRRILALAADYMVENAQLRERRALIMAGSDEDSISKHSRQFRNSREQLMAAARERAMRLTSTAPVPHALVGYNALVASPVHRYMEAISQVFLNSPHFKIAQRVLSQHQAWANLMRHHESFGYLFEATSGARKLHEALRVRPDLLSILGFAGVPPRRGP